MSSPFATYEEFSNAEGPIYTFANNSVMIAILLILSVLITAYFFYISFFMKQKPLSTPNLSALGVLLVAGLTSMLGTVFAPEATRQMDAMKPRASSQEAQTSQKTWAPLAFLGLAGIGGVTIERRSKRRSLRRVRN